MDEEDGECGVRTGDGGIDRRKGVVIERYVVVSVQVGTQVIQILEKSVARAVGNEGEPKANTHSSTLMSMRAQPQIRAVCVRCEEERGSWALP
jgi:hypothetical protein